MSYQSDDSGSLEFPSSPGGQGRGWGSDLEDVGELGDEPEVRSSHRGDLGYTNPVMRPIMEVQEVKEDSDHDKANFGIPKVLKIRVPVLVSKVKQTKRGRNNASTDEDEEEALPKKTKKALKSAAIKDPAKKKHKPALLSSDDELPIDTDETVSPI